MDPPSALRRGLSGRIGEACRRFLSLPGDPREIALGFALGLFVGMSPFMMCHTVTAVFFASLLKWSRIAAALGVVITNPFTAPFFYALTFRVGAAVLPGTSLRPTVPSEFSVEALTALIQNGPEILWILMVGGVATGVPIALAGYLLTYRLIRRHRNRQGGRPVP